MQTAAIIVAAGRGERAGGGLPKQYRPLLGRPVVRWSLDALAQRVDRLVAVIDPAHAELFATASDGCVAEITHGASDRTGSVRAGLAALMRGEEPETVLIHDAARPGLDGGVIDRLHEALARSPAAAPALSIDDALKRADPTGGVIGEAARSGLMRVQTPQAFRFAAIKRAYDNFSGTADDDLAVARAAGVEAVLIPGSARLMKLTHAEDFAVMEHMLASAQYPCVGTGFDAHRFGPGDHVTLCGVRIAHDRGIIGHSDADVGWHALTDALLGAIGAGDIGQHFPPSDLQWRGADSILFLKYAADLVREAGGRIAHVDVTLICERPKVGPHREAMRARTAEALGLKVERVSVKATTTEKMGFMGREEGMAAQAAATVLMPG